MKTQLYPSWIINLFFVTGLVSALLFRALVIFNYYQSSWSRIIWYGAVVGYIFFFGFRFFISYRRRKTIRENDLIGKVMKSDLDPSDRDEIEYIMQSLIRSREMFNYIFIFIVSAIAIAIDIFLALYFKS